MTIPRSLQKSTLERLLISETRMSPGAGGGISRHVRSAVRRGLISGLQAAGLIAIVFHGDDGTVVRPGVLWVIWVGLATPLNGLDFDGWYVGNVTL
jgi:hypothetical protein